MAKKFEFKALLPASTDIVSFWKAIENKKGGHLGGEGSCYSVTFSGPVDVGIKMLEPILRLDEYEVTIKSVQKGG